MKKLITTPPTLHLSWISKLSAVVFLSLLSFTSANAQWQMVGGVNVTTSLTYCSSMEVSSDGTPYVAFRDATSLNKLSVKKYNGSEWVYVGTAGFSAGIIDHTDIEIDGSGTPYVSFTDASLSNKACVMKFNGTTWVNVGTAGFSASTAFGMRMDLSTTGLPYVCFIDGTNAKPTVMRFNSTSWVTVGVAGIGMTNTVYSDFGTISLRQNILGIELDAASNIYVAAVEYVNAVTRKASVFKFNGTTWSTLPDVGTSVGLSIDISVDPVSSQPYLVYTAASQGPLSVKKYDGTNWLSVGAVAPFSGIANNVKIDFSNNKPVVANWNLSAGYKLDVYEFDGTAWNFVGGTVRPSNDSFVSAELAIDGSGNKYVGGFRQTSGGYFQAFKYCTTIPTISVSPTTICGPAMATLTATVSAGVVSWYASSTSTTALATGVTYTSPSISANATYYAKTDNKGCASAITSALVTVKPTPVITFSGASIDTICGSGTTTVSAFASGHSGSTINWYISSFAGLIQGTGNDYITPTLTTSRNYYAEALLNGCKSTPRAIVPITVQANPTITSTSPNAVCVSGAVNLNAVGSNGSTLSWYAASTGGSALASGTNYTTPNISTTTTYYVQAKNGICSSSRTPIIATVNGLPNATVTINGNLLTATETGATYQWATCGSRNSFTPISLGGSSSQSYTAPSAGSYAVFVTKNGCKDTSVCNNVTITGIEDESSTQSGFNIYPNPSNGDFTIEQSENATIQILNNAGQTVIQIPSTEKSYKVSGLSEGMYFVRIQGNGKTVTKKVLVTK
jgi:hypothetical protein